MSTLGSLLRTAEHTLLLIRQLVCYAGTFLRALFLPKASLAARRLAAESQLAACTLRIHQKKESLHLAPSFVQVPHHLEQYRPMTSVAFVATFGSDGVFRGDSSLDASQGTSCGVCYLRSQDTLGARLY
jgi:hypothetical protein